MDFLEINSNDLDLLPLNNANDFSSKLAADELY